MDFIVDRELACLRRKERRYRERSRELERRRFVAEHPHQISSVQFIQNFEVLSRERRAIIVRYDELAEGLDVPQVPRSWEWPVD
jgi:hypothetical protein